MSVDQDEKVNIQFTKLVHKNFCAIFRIERNSSKETFGEISFSITMQESLCQRPVVERN